MDKRDRYWGIRLLAMALKAREDGDLVTAELLTDDAIEQLIRAKEQRESVYFVQRAS